MNLKLDLGLRFWFKVGPTIRLAGTVPV